MLFSALDDKGFQWRLLSLKGLIHFENIESLHLLSVWAHNRFYHIIQIFFFLNREDTEIYLRQGSDSEEDQEQVDEEDEEEKKELESFREFLNNQKIKREQQRHSTLPSWGNHLQYLVVLDVPQRALCSSRKTFQPVLLNMYVINDLFYNVFITTLFLFTFLCDIFNGRWGWKAHE